ncbi:hypothetical protein [Halalkalibacter sp. APA_J-10(15)]|uniref:phage tail protein n=1 Tax=Halalkalibacter sp. APA_J-10(15) TaxID=2933805 RepID=UPI001FF12645|nr:hypothetical protein [Halalkalibacter sp. APA_J-10(15)]MCK0473777.1 hypothetical protein [Halalkalibacter sp. APA_J-10(15)]
MANGKIGIHITLDAESVVENLEYDSISIDVIESIESITVNSENAATALNWLEEAIKGIVFGFDATVQTIEKFNTLITTFDNSIEAFDSLKDIVEIVKYKMDGLGKTMIASPWFWVIAAITALVLAFIYLYNNNEWFKEQVDRIWLEIQEYIAVALEFIQNIVTVVMEWLSDFVGTILETIREFWETHGEEIMYYVGLVWGFIETVIKTIGETIVMIVTGIIGIIEDTWDKHGETIMTIIEFIWGVISSLIGVYIHSLWTTIKVVLDFINKYWEDIWNVISMVLTVAWATIRRNVQNGIDLVMGIIKTVMALIKGDWEGAWEAIKETAENIIQNFIKFFEAINLSDTGKEIISGLINGISSMGSAVWDSVKNIGNSIKDGFKSFFNIRSPSRWMRDQIGVNLMKGFEIGIDKEKRNVLKKSDEAAEWMKPEIFQVEHAIPNMRQGLSNNTSIINQSNGSTLNMDHVERLLERIAEKQSDVYLDNRKVGMMQWKIVTELQERNKSRQQRVPSQRGAFV